MEVQFTEQIEQLQLGGGATFHGEGILAITKALLQSGVAYVGGYQGAPVSHLLDVMVQARPYLDDAGRACRGLLERGLGGGDAGRVDPLPAARRGDLEVASSAPTSRPTRCRNLASPGVVGGALIVVGEDYGEGASVIQERTHAYAMKSTLAAVRPAARSRQHGSPGRTCLRAVSEASNMPAVMELRIRACHVRGSFDGQGQPRTRGLDQAPDRGAGGVRLHAAGAPAGDLPPREAEDRAAPAGGAGATSPRTGSTSISTARAPRSASSCRAACTTRWCARCSRSAWPTPFGASDAAAAGAQRDLPAGAGRAERVLRRQARGAGARGRPPEYIEKDLVQALRRLDVQHAGARQGPAAAGRRIHGRGRRAGADRASSSDTCRDVDLAAARAWLAGNARAARRRRARRSAPLPARPPGFCIGCPERPVFSALKLAQQDVGPVHIAADIGCHALGHLRALQLGPLDPRLRHEPGQPRRRRRR